MAKLVLLLVFVCFQFSRSEELPAIEQVKLDINEDEIPFNNQTAPDTEILDGTDEDQWNPSPKFNEDWLNENLPESEEVSNNTGSNALSELQKLIEELKELIAQYPDSYSYEWDLDDLSDEDYSYWDMLDSDYISQDLEAVINKNGNFYKYNTVASLRKLKNSNDDEIVQNWRNGKVHPLKRFTSV